MVTVRAGIRINCSSQILELNAFLLTNKLPKVFVYHSRVIHRNSRKIGVQVVQMALVKILLFAGAKDAVGAEIISIDVQPPMTARELKSTIATNHPRLEPILRFSRLAIGKQFVNDDHVVALDTLDEDFALIPPVSGG